MEKLQENLCWIDHLDRIVRVGPFWDQFLLDNDGGGECSSSEIQGKSVWEFVLGDPTRIWLNTLLSLARLRKSPVERPYRCDSPHVRRFMQMNIIPEETKLVRMEHILVREEQRVVTVEIHLAPRVAENLYRRCSICCRVDFGGTWTEPDNPPESWGDAPLRPLQVIYAVCEECQRLLP